MSRPKINATLFNVSTEDDGYQVLREQMVHDLTGDELHQPLDTKLGMLEDFVWRMFSDMEDDVLQVHYDALLELDEEPTMEEVLEEYAEELRAEGKDVETMIITPGDLDE